MYTIPLRRALVTHSDLPYPEGVACAEVLKVGVPRAESADAAGEAQDAGLARDGRGHVRIGAVFLSWSRHSYLPSDFARITSASGTAARPRAMTCSLSFALFARRPSGGLAVGIAMRGGRC